MRALAIVVVLVAGCDKKFNPEYCIKHGDDPTYAQYCHPDANLIDAKIPDGPPNTYRILLSVSGLNGTVVLQNNGGDDLTVTADGPYYFSMTVLTGAMYEVTVKTQPASQTCMVAMGTGTVHDADVMGIVVTCAGDPGIRCGTTTCVLGDSCCYGTSMCAGVTGCTSLLMHCDDSADCGGTNVCCGELNNGNMPKDAVCKATVGDCRSGNANNEILCDPNAPGGDAACVAAVLTCRPAIKFVNGNYSSCQP